MAAYSRIQVIAKLSETGLLPIFYNRDPEIVVRAMHACYEGGARLFEFTNRGDFSQETFSEIVKHASSELPELIVGVGSILDAPTAVMFMQMGANFIVSPVLNSEIASVCNRRKILWIPGCGSVSEISNAEGLGAEIIKLFPAFQTSGPDFIKAVKGPMPWTDILPTGGIEPTEESITPWIKAGAFAIGLGSKLFTNDIILNLNFEKLKKDVSHVLSIINNARK